MQLARSESASAGSGFSWKPWIRPSAPVTITPYSLVSVDPLHGRERRDPVVLGVRPGERPEVDVGECVGGDDHERLGAEEVAHVADTAGRAEQLLLLAVGELDAEPRAVAEGAADRVAEPVQVGDDLVEAVAREQRRRCAP